VRSSLLGPHARFAQRHGGVLRYLPSVSPFAALTDQPGTVTGPTLRRWRARVGWFR